MKTVKGFKICIGIGSNMGVHFGLKKGERVRRSLVKIAYRSFKWVSARHFIKQSFSVYDLFYFLKT